MDTKPVVNGKSYTLNGTTDIKVVEEDDRYWVVEIGGMPPLKARILKDDIVDGINAGTLVEA